MRGREREGIRREGVKGDGGVGKEGREGAVGDGREEGRAEAAGADDSCRSRGGREYRER